MDKPEEPLPEASVPDEEPSSRTDAELQRQLDAPALLGEAIEAVFALRTKLHQAAPPPEETEKLAKELLDRVRDKVGRPAAGLRVFRHLGRFAVSADREFVREMIEQPEIATAQANRRSDSD